MNWFLNLQPKVSTNILIMSENITIRQKGGFYSTKSTGIIQCGFNICTHDLYCRACALSHNVLLHMSLRRNNRLLF